MQSWRQGHIRGRVPRQPEARQDSASGHCKTRVVEREGGPGKSTAKYDAPAARTRPGYARDTEILTALQIWFQNRRQNDRRKSRPLTPQEVAALRSGGMQIVADPSIPGSSILTETPYSSAPAQSDASNDPSPASSHVSVSPQLAKQDGYDANASPGNGDAEDKTEGAVGPVKSPAMEPVVHTPGLSQSFPGATGYLANRWNASTFSTPSMARDETLR